MNTHSTQRVLAIITAGLLASFSTGPCAAAVTIDYTAQTGQRHVIDHRGALVAPNWGEVRVGVLGSDFDPARHGGDLHRLQEAWTQLGTSPIREVLGQPSRFSAHAVVEGAGLSGRKIYLWVVTTTNGSSVSSSFDNVRSHGLFSSSEAHWRVPFEAGLPPLNSTIVNSSQIDQSFAGELTGQFLRLGQPTSVEIDYDGWQDTRFPASTPAQQRQPLADPDGDGIVNLVERFVGGDPAQEDESPFTTSFKSTYVEFRFNRAKDVPAGAASLLISNDLEDWVETRETAIMIADLGDREQMAIRIPLGSLPAGWRQGLFFRLEVTL
ncbi:MAG: hypothetical protein ACI9NC_001228 [Verrucomicrobiales bacterium]|jgi:hypothetical protein